MWGKNHDLNGIGCLSVTDDPVCATVLSKESQVSSHPMVRFSAINHCVCIGVIFAYTGYFNLVQDLCRLLPVETNHKAERCPAEWIWFPCWKGLCGQMQFSPVAITAAMAPFKMRLPLLVLRHLQRAGSEQRCRGLMYDMPSDRKGLMRREN